MLFSSQVQTLSAVDILASLGAALKGLAKFYVFILSKFMLTHIDSCCSVNGFSGRHIGFIGAALPGQLLLCLGSSCSLSSYTIPATGHSPVHRKDGCWLPQPKKWEGWWSGSRSQHRRHKWEGCWNLPRPPSRDLGQEQDHVEPRKGERQETEFSSFSNFKGPTSSMIGDVEVRYVTTWYELWAHVVKQLMDRWYLWYDSFYKHLLYYYLQWWVGGWSFELAHLRLWLVNFFPPQPRLAASDSLPSVVAIVYVYYWCSVQSH